MSSRVLRRAVSGSRRRGVHRMLKRQREERELELKAKTKEIKS